MFGLLDLTLTIRSDQQRKHRLENAEFVEWTPKAKFQKECNFTATSWNEWVRSVAPFDVEDQPIDVVECMNHDMMVFSEEKKFAYSHTRLPRGSVLWTASGNKRGTVMFDDDVVIPRLNQRGKLGRYWKSPWMSFTPMEVFTLRPGTRKAKGHTVVCGLGLGYQLVEVSNKRSVKKVTLIERDDELIEMMLPVILPRLGCEIEVVQDNCWKVIPKISADVALLDVFFGYGSNYCPVCTPNIETVWCWGSSCV